MLSKLTKLINKFYSNCACTDFLQDHSVPFYNSNMMLCGACTDTNTIHTLPHKRPVFVIRQIRYSAKFSEDEIWRINEGGPVIIQFQHLQSYFWNN